MGTNPATVATIPKMVHLGVDTEFHVAPGERVIFAGHGEFAVVFPDDSPFGELVFNHTHARTLPARECQGRFHYYWARAGLVGAGAKPRGVEVTGVFGPILKEGADSAPPKGGSGVIVVP
jgi:hypothetical protein